MINVYVVYNIVKLRGVEKIFADKESAREYLDVEYKKAGQIKTTKELDKEIHEFNVESNSLFG